MRGVVRDWRHGADLVLVAVVTDLEERDEAGEPVLLGRLAWLGLGLGLGLGLAYQGLRLLVQRAESATWAGLTGGLAWRGQ